MKKLRHPRLLSLPIVLLFVCTVAVSAFLLPTRTTKAASTSCQVTYTLIAQWPASPHAPGGFEAFLTIKNTGSTAINGWTMNFAFPNGQVIFAHFGGANLTQSGANVTVTNAAFNGTIPPGMDVFYAPGFNANWWGTNQPPTSISVNNVPCSVVVVGFH